MLDALITSKTRIKLLLKFFLNPENTAHLRGLSTEFNESTNAIRLELNKLEQTNMLKSRAEGNRRLYSVNRQHPLYDEINGIVRKYFGLDVIVEKVVRKLGRLQEVYLTGDIAKGMDAKIIDLVLVGEIDRHFLNDLIVKAEKLINRKIRYLHYSEEEFKNTGLTENEAYVLIWGTGSSSLNYDASLGRIGSET